VPKGAQQVEQGHAHLGIQVGDGAAGEEADGRLVRLALVKGGHPGEEVACRDGRQGASPEAAGGKAQAQAAGQGIF
jgi:hypothetical protein